MHDAASGLLSFYARLAEQQRELARRWESIVPRAERLASAGDSEGPPALLTSGDVELVLDVVPALLGWLGCEAPPGLVEATAALARLDDADWRAAAEGYLAGRGDVRDPDLAPVTFVLEAACQPLAALAADAVRIASHSMTVSSRCPRCDSLPVSGVVREEAHVATRQLVCGLCLHEWPFARLACLSCGERAFDKLPVYTAEQWPAARVEACETCRVYIKTLDATKDGLIVPAVDDLATVALDLWAREQG